MRRESLNDEIDVRVRSRVPGRGPRLFTGLIAALLVSTTLTLFGPALSASAQHTHGDGGEQSDDLLRDALKEGSPEELEARRAELGRRLEAAGSKRAFIQQVQTQSSEALAELDAEMNETQRRLEAARAHADNAGVQLQRATEKSAEATEQAELAADELREAAVDMFINPPQADSLRAALTSTVEEELASAGLLVGRAEIREEISERRDRAQAIADKAERLAAEASTQADEAALWVEEAMADLQRQLDDRNAELQTLREDLALIEDELSGLQLTDAILANRLAIDELARGGSVSGSGVTGLPTRADMVQIGSTGTWVHHLVAPAVTAMFEDALADGVVLVGGAYRDSLRQIELRMKHCGTSQQAIYEMRSSSCSPPTARPGRSMHERGLAIDFSEGNSALTRSSAGFRWLSANAAKYGFFNLPSEPWHWSVNGN